MAIEPKLMSATSLEGAADLARKGATDVEGIYTDPRFYAGMSLTLLAHIAAQATELQQLRAAKAADRERVRSVVHEASVEAERVRSVVHEASVKAQRWILGSDQIANFIATRVADALAVPVHASISEGDREALQRTREYLLGQVGEWVGWPREAVVKRELVALDRLLSARPIPPLVRELVQREFNRVPADPKYDGERQQLMECLEALP